MRQGHWSGFRLLALLIAALGAWGVLRGLPDVLRAGPPMMRRLEPGETVQALLRDYPANFVVLAIFVLFMVILCIHFMGVLRDLYRYSPVAALTGGVFLGGSVLFGISLNLTGLKINEFAFADCPRQRTTSRLVYSRTADLAARRNQFPESIAPHFRLGLAPMFGTGIRFRRRGNAGRALAEPPDPSCGWPWPFRRVGPGVRCAA